MHLSHDKMQYDTLQLEVSILTDPDVFTVPLIVTVSSNHTVHGVSLSSKNRLNV